MTNEEWEKFTAPGKPFKVGPALQMKKIPSFYVTTTLLGCEPDTNSRHVYRLADHKLVATFNRQRDPWTAQDEKKVREFVESLEAGKTPTTP